MCKLAELCKCVLCIEAVAQFLDTVQSDSVEVQRRTSSEEIKLTGTAQAENCCKGLSAVLLPSTSRCSGQLRVQCRAE